MDSASSSNGWPLYQTVIFGRYLEDLQNKVILILDKETDENIISHPLIKLHSSIINSIKVNVPSDPSHVDFRLGKTLGPDFRRWRRVKKGMPTRYRLFFRYNSSDPKCIIYAYFNGEGELRKEGDRHDIYTVFKRRLESGEIPNCIHALMSEAEKCQFKKL